MMLKIFIRKPNFLWGSKNVAFYIFIESIGDLNSKLTQKVTFFPILVKALLM